MEVEEVMEAMEVEESTDIQVEMQPDIQVGLMEVLEVMEEMELMVD
jgi:PHP family Zn ribbon phosphoesterase